MNYARMKEVNMQFKVRYDRWLWPILALVPIVPLIRSVTLFADDQSELGFALVGIAIVASVALWFVLPRSIKLSHDRVSVALGWRWHFNMPMSSISEISSAHGVKPWLRIGGGFATSFRRPVLIRRISGMSILVSPETPDQFIQSARDFAASVD
jgi:hypothetical protein